MNRLLHDVVRALWPGTLPRIGPALARTVAPLLRCPVCLAAPAGDGGLCRDCDSLLDAALARLPPPSGAVTWLGPYAGPWLRLVHAMKFAGGVRLADTFGGKLAARCLRWSWRPDLVCHVPASPARLAERGYDQAERLARTAAAGLGAEHAAALARSGAAAKQATLSRPARALNADGAFRSRRLPGRRVLLVDDVLTTGATAAACTRALLDAGAAEVRTAVVARTVRASDEADRRHSTTMTAVRMPSNAPTTT